MKFPTISKSADIGKLMCGNIYFGCPAALYILMSALGAEEPEFLLSFEPSYQNNNKDVITKIELPKFFTTWLLLIGVK